MRPNTMLLIIAAHLSACGTVATATSLIFIGDDRNQVISKLGAPFYRQVNGEREAWQYCEINANSSYPEYKLVWIQAGRVTKINSYRSSRAGSSCGADMRIVKWEDPRSVSTEPPIR